MPLIELHLDKMSITGENAKKEQYPFLRAIYTYNAYYGTQGNKLLKVYFSKAFEILSTSILSSAFFSSEIKNNKHIFEEILNHAPFYSVYNLSPTKQIDEEKQGEKDDSSIYNITTDDCDSFIKKLDEWNEKHCKKISPLFTSTAQLISLLCAVFNKSFTQVAYLRKEFEPSKGDELVDLVLRFKYIILNAFGFFLKKSGVRIAANIAIDAERKTLRNESEFKKSPTYKYNVEWANDEDNGKYKEFMQSIEEHPVFVKFDYKKTSARITNQSNSGQSTQSTKNTRGRPSKIDKHSPDTALKQKAMILFRKYFSEEDFGRFKSLTDYIIERGAIDNENIKKKSSELFLEFKGLLGDIEKLYKTTDLVKLYSELSQIFDEGQSNA